MTQQQLRQIIEANTSIPNEAHEMLLKEAEDTEHSYKQLWARVFSRTDSKAEAFEYMQKLCQKVGAWSPSRMTLEQIEAAYRLTNYL